jgi:hypothetical protein
MSAGTGGRGYAPADLLKLYIYGDLNRARSSRRLEAEIPIGRDPRSAASFNQASVQSRASAAFRRRCPDAGSRRTLNHSCCSKMRFR